MARFLVWSDLHDEFWRGFDLPDVSAPVDGVLIAGDTHTLGQHLEIPAAAARKYDCPVVVIWGNHEPYGSIWSELMEDEAHQLIGLRAAGHDIRILHGAETHIAGVRIVGATLWSDLQLYPELAHLAPTMVRSNLADYRAIHTAAGCRFTIEDMLDRHVQDKVAIFDSLRAPHDGETVVMTHHLPVKQLIAPHRMIGPPGQQVVSAGFASNLWDEIREFDVHTWICGHAHEGENWTGRGNHGPIRFVMNQRGYPGEGTVFDPEFVIEV